ncbi:MAG: metallophosphoesterase family protein, partial [Verrucomicrobiales bacterium]|nr:metallophosphoesterase family protein [Verrucomicrobiales bacterium]
RMEVTPGVWLDARRAVWLEGHRALLVADVHLGYVWAERQRGALLPLVEEDAGPRLLELARAYPVERVIFLGDVVHATARNHVLEDELRGVLETLGQCAELTFVLGNHDEQLPAMLERVGARQSTTRRLRLGSHVLVHGDAVGWEEVSGELAGEGMVFSGHEHPAVRLGDGVATEVKVPAFVVGPRHVVLPAFSRWSAGQPFGRQAPLSSLVDPAKFRRAVGVLGHRLLPLELLPDGRVLPLRPSGVGGLARDPC